MATAPTFVRFCRSLALLSGPVPLVAIVIPAVVVGAIDCSMGDNGGLPYPYDSEPDTQSDSGHKDTALDTPADESEADASIEDSSAEEADALGDTLEAADAGADVD